MGLGQLGVLGLPLATKEAGKILAEHRACSERRRLLVEAENGYWEGDRQQGRPPKAVRR